MEFLTPDHVNKIADKSLQEGGFYRYLHPTSVPYIIKILTPHARAVDQAQSRKDLIDWINGYSPIAELNVRKLLLGIDNDNVTKMKSKVVEMLIEFVITGGEGIALHHRSVVVLPWDIAEFLEKAQGIVQKGLFPEVTAQLPVTFVVGNNTFEHKVTEEFVAGLIDGYLAAGNDVPLIFLYNQELPSDYTWTYRDSTRIELQLYPIKDRRHNEGGRYKYIAWYHKGQEKKSKLPKNDRGFNTMDYLQGATTSVQWQGLDVDSLISQVTDDQYQILTF